ncbi:MAG: HD domain-containing protein [Phycisphaerales bacterium]|nr:HD domain-containing protein [Phycisphaerales bacterium]
MSKRTLIRDLLPNQWVSGIYAIQNCQLGTTKTGKPFIKCILGDRSKKVPGRMWNASEELFASLPTDGFVQVEGQTQPYQGEMQIIIQQIEPAKPTGEDLLELLPRTENDIPTMLVEVVRLITSVQDPALRALVQAYLDDAPLMGQFRQAPAAMNLHHAYIGGLLEHTLSMLRLGDMYCKLTPQLNRDLLLVGLFIHDLGKCSELTWTTGFGYSDRGQLVGHIGEGMLWLDQKARQCEAKGVKIPSAILNVLLHIVLSHHGRPEFGALKIPATPEAIAVSLLDNLDAKMQMAITAANRGEGGMNQPADLHGNFTEKVWALDTRVYRPDPTTVED